MDPDDRQELKPRLGRRRLLLGAGALAGAGALDAFAIEPAWLEVSHHVLALDRLPSALEGFTLAQVTDAHLRSFGRVERGIVEAVKRAQVQLVVLTGDIVDRSAGLPVLAELVSALRAAGAEVVATLGNWEHWAGFTALGLSQEYARLGARLVVNECVVARGVVVAATDDGYAGAPRWDHTLASLAAVQGAGAPRLLLTHSPAMFQRVPEQVPHFDLALAGHTHGGQLVLGSFAPLVPPGSGPYVKGFYETRAGRAYVSRGTGTSVIAARFMCRPELPVFRLTARR